MQSSSRIITNKPTSIFLQAGCPSCRSTNSVNTLKGKISLSMDLLAYPKLTWGIPTFSLTTDSSWLPWWGFLCLSSALWCQYPNWFALSRLPFTPLHSCWIHLATVAQNRIIANSLLTYTTEPHLPISSTLSFILQLNITFTVSQYGSHCCSCELTNRILSTLYCSNL